MIFMIVEDDVNTVFLISYFAKTECNLETHNFYSLKSAMDYIDFVRPDAILLDYVLHGLVAEPFVHKLQEKYSNNLPLICLMTAAQNPQRIADKLGTHYLLEKPFTLEHLHEMIVKLCDIKQKEK